MTYLRRFTDSQLALLPLPPLSLPLFFCKLFLIPSLSNIDREDYFVPGDESVSLRIIDFKAALGNIDDS